MARLRVGSKRDTRGADGMADDSGALAAAGACWVVWRASPRPESASSYYLCSNLAPCATRTHPRAAAWSRPLNPRSAAFARAPRASCIAPSVASRPFRPFQRAVPGIGGSREEPW